MCVLYSFIEITWWADAHTAIHKEESGRERERERGFYAIRGLWQYADGLTDLKALSSVAVKIITWILWWDYN